METKRSRPSSGPHPPDSNMAREYVDVLRRRHSYIVASAEERRRQGRPASLEFLEAAALAWALAIVEQNGWTRLDSATAPIVESIEKGRKP